MLEDLMKILGGAEGQRASAAHEEDPLMDILGGILGGGGQGRGRARRPAAGGDPLGEILGAILGGGGQKGLGGSPFMAPIANALAERLGISPQMALQVLGFALAILTSFMQSKDQAQTPGPGSRDRRAQESQGMDLDELLEGDYLRSTGMTARLAQESGMDEDMAARSLQEALMLLSNPEQLATPSSKGRPSSLDHLLDSWETD